MFTYPGLEKADKLLEIYTFNELRVLMRTRWEGGFISSLYELQAKIKGSPAEILALINKAGADGTGNMERLRRIVSRLKSEGVTVEEAVAAIKESDEFAGNLAAAMGDANSGFERIAKQLWGEGVTVKDGMIEVAPSMAKGKKGSGKVAIKQIMGDEGKLDDLVERFIVDGNKINLANWGVVRDVILKAKNLAEGIKSNVIGELWNRINLVEWSRAGFEDITREVELIAGGTTCRADAIAVKNGEMYILEFKSLNGEFTAGQKSYIHSWKRVTLPQ